MSASFSPCGTYRYTLGRYLQGGAGEVLFVMLNPSTADADNDDPTIRRCIGFAEREGYAVLRVLNLFAARATNPKALAEFDDPVGERNMRELRWYSEGADQIVAAWGAHAFAHLQAERVKRMWAGMDIEVKCLGTTKNGSPRHPLYVKRDAPLVGFPLGEAA